MLINLYIVSKTFTNLFVKHSPIFLQFVMSRPERNKRKHVRYIFLFIFVFQKHDLW